MGTQHSLDATRRSVNGLCRQTEGTPSRRSTGAYYERDDPGSEGHLEAARNVLRTLIFYDLFGCPVRLGELAQRTIGGLPDCWSSDPRAMITAHPILSQHVCLARGYVFLRTAQAEFERWEAAERMRWQCIRRYEKWVRLFCRIPFVRMITVTGSLSFPMASHVPDCDLFVVAAGNRLWIVVALSRLLFFRILPKLRLIRHGEICPNYVVDEHALSEVAGDLFDTMQIAAMSLVVGREAYHRLVYSHRGLKRFFPHWQPPAPLFDHTVRSPPRLMRRLVELALRPLPLDWLDRWLCQRLSRRFEPARRHAQVGDATESALGQLAGAWVRHVVDLSVASYRLSPHEFKVHGSRKLELVARYDKALRDHPASSFIRLTADGNDAPESS